MKSNELRVPKQQRSIEKRNKIIEAGFKLFCEKGYYNTNTAEIARQAGVSTGIIYSYFKDKKDIYIKALEEYSDQIDAPLYDILKELKPPVDIASTVRLCISRLAQSHTVLKSVHEEMQAMAHTDDDIGELFNRYRANIAKRLVEIMEQLNIHPENAFEKAFLIATIIENLIHEMVYHSNSYLDYEVVKEETVKIITGMLTN